MSTNPEMGLIFIPSIQPELKHYTIHGPTMGTRYSASFYAPSSIDIAKLQRYLQRAVDNVDDQMSPWKKQSDLVRFNAEPIEKWIDIPLEMAVVINQALNISNLSNGAFNIGVGDLINMWGFGPDEKFVDDPSSDTLVVPPAHHVFELDMERFQLKRNAAVALDLCGIAKGFGVDELARVLINFDINDFFVSIDGEIKASGSKPGDTPWNVGIENPDPLIRDADISLEIEDIAIATSGDYRHFKNTGDHQVSHTMNAERGLPVISKTTSVTIATKHCISADAWATALMVMDRKDAIALADQIGIDAYICERSDEGVYSYAAGAFSALASELN